MNKYAIVVSSVLAVSASMASADFVYQQGFTVNTNTSSGGIHGLASDGDQFYIGVFTDGISVHDGGFDQLSIIPNPGPFGGIRGLAFDQSNGTLLAGNHDSGDVYRVSTDGSLLNTFNVMGSSQLNAVGVDGNSGDVFVAGYNGNIQRHSSTGALISSFSLGSTLTGLAIDDVNESVFVMSSQTDRVYEYDYSGNLISTAIIDATPQPSANGQGLYYNNTTGQLYVTAQSGRISIYADSTRAVVPAPGALALFGLSGVAATRRRRPSARLR